MYVNLHVSFCSVLKNIPSSFSQMSAILSPTFQTNYHEISSWKLWFFFLNDDRLR